MIKLYFQLQFIILNRKLKEAIGINPIFLMILIPIAFFYGSEGIFKVTDNSKAIFIYLFIALWFSIKNYKKSKSDFLKINLLDNLDWKIKLIENILIVIPFCAFLIYKSYFEYSIIFFMLSLIVSFIPRKFKFNFVIPTPFPKESFEFIIGFRKNFYLFLILIFILIQSIIFSNENLGLVTLISTLYVCSFFYIKPEEKFYVWIYSLTPSTFLLHKIRLAIINSIIISIPFFITLTVFNITHIYMYLIAITVGIAVIITSIVSKYSNYPEELNIQQLFIIAISMIFPFIIPLLIFFSYKRSLTNLKTIL